MRVTTVGSGDAFGSGGRFQTCIALAAHSADVPSVLLDCGATSLTALRQQQIDLNQIEAVLVTHLHGDHFGGLPFLVLGAVPPPYPRPHRLRPTRHPYPARRGTARRSVRGISCGNAAGQRGCLREGVP